ncbi:MAG: hypothetical protein DWQ02_09175 [Bacteroidetes bacterium]|nr:MAG: hypothetical protein DWQ02_09175 [Bacteroidota bacterium]
MQGAECPEQEEFVQAGAVLAEGGDSLSSAIIAGIGAQWIARCQACLLTQEAGEAEAWTQ